MTRISIIRKPFSDSGLNPGDVMSLPQSMAQDWISRGVAVYVDGDACKPGPKVEPVERKKNNLGTWKR